MKQVTACYRCWAAVTLGLAVWFCGGKSLAGDSAASSSASPLAQWRSELTALAGMASPAGDAAVSDWLDRLLAGKLPKEIWFEVLEAANKHKVPPILEKLEQYQTARLDEGGVATYSEVLYGGNPELGKKIFFEKPEAICVKCHKVGQQGGDTGPILGSASTNLSREFILESLLSPNAKITPGYETVTIRLNDNNSYSGIIKRETEKELTLDCPPDGLVTIVKSNIEARRKAGSLMPDGLDQTLSRRELRDLVEFLASLKSDPGAGAGPATNPEVAQAVATQVHDPK